MDELGTAKQLLLGHFFASMIIFDLSFSYFSLVFDQPGRSGGEEIRTSWRSKCMYIILNSNMNCEWYVLILHINITFRKWINIFAFYL